MAFGNFSDGLALAAVAPDSSTIQVPRIAADVLALETGVRPGELAGLKLDGVDWQAGTIRIEQSVWQGELQTPKSQRAIPTFAISSELVKRRRAYRRDHWMRNELGLMFASKRGTPLSMDNFRNRVLNPILRQLGIDKKLKAM